MRAAIAANGRTASTPLTAFRATMRRDGGPTRLLMAVGLVVAALWAAGAGPFVGLVAQSCAIFAVAAVGQSLLIGGAGQIALSGGAFMAIGAFTTGILADHGVDTFPLPLLIAGLVGWLVGLLSGLPGLRFQGLYLLLASLALQFIVTSLTRQFQAATDPAGIVVPLMTLGPIDLSAGTPMYLALMTILAIVYAIAWALERTGVGLAWRALKESEVAAAMSGIDVVRWKLYAFALSGAMTAVAGSMFAYWVGRADYHIYDLALSISLATMVFIGGVRSRLGAIIGAVIITSLPYFLQATVSVWMARAGIAFDWYLNNASIVNAGLFSFLFLLVILFEPDGIEGLLHKAERLVRSLLRTVAARRSGGPA